MSKTEMKEERQHEKVYDPLPPTPDPTPKHEPASEHVPIEPPPSYGMLEAQIAGLKAQVMEYQGMFQGEAEKYSIASDNELVLQSALEQALKYVAAAPNVNVQTWQKLANASLQTRLRTNPPTT